MAKSQKQFPTLIYPLDWSQFTVEKLPALIEVALKLAKERLKGLEEMPLEKVTYANFVIALDEFSRELGEIWGIAHHLAGVDDNPKIRAIINKFMPTISEFYAKVGVSEALWKRLKKVKNSAEARKLPALQKRHLLLSVKSFIRSGAQLKPDEKKELIEIQKELSMLSEKFSKAVLDATNKFEKRFPEGAEKTSLKGLPPSALEIGRAGAKEKNIKGYRFTLQAPSLTAILTYADDRKLREEFSYQSREVGRQKPFDTLPFIKRTLELRQKKAKLLGFKTYAAFVTQNRMLNSPQKIREFLKKVASKVRSLSLKEFKKLAAFKKELGDKTPMEPWDSAYYGEKLQQKLLHLESEKLKPYFEFEATRKTLFELAERLYNIEIKPIKAHKAWHKTVEYFEIRHKKSGRLAGGFYTDFFARSTKRGGAWENDLIARSADKNGNLLPRVALICGNFAPPSDNAPSLLTHDEVETLYHEFGHLMHELLSAVPIASLSGTSVPRDFVELPSQLMENYCYNEKYLSMIARHYKTGEKLDAKTIKDLRASRNFMRSGFHSHLTFHSLFDLELHDSAKIPSDIEGFVKKIYDGFKLPYKTQPISRLRKFSHLWSGGYATGYYSYQWSQVLEADAWNYFERHGILSPAVGRKFMTTILSRGDSEPAQKLFKDFMGRAPKLDAYLKRIEGK
jgi:oligopeptidase A